MDDDPSDELLAFFNSPEGVEGDYVTHGRQFSVQLDVDGGVLNFNRAEDNGAVRFGFNYHHSISEPEQYTSVVPGLVEKSRGHAAAFLASLYGLNEFQIITYMQVSEQETAVVEAGENPVVDDHNQTIEFS